MWPIIKKELRENARYLLGAFGIILFPWTSPPLRAVGRFSACGWY